MKTRIEFDIVAQPDDSTCGATCLHSIYRYHGDRIANWIGFNASHSMGAMLFGLLYGCLAWNHAEMLFSSIFLMVLGGAMLAGYLVLGRIYWFRIPLAAISVASVCYTGSIVAHQF